MRRALPLLLLAATIACGRRSRPLPPELVQPTPPTALAARSTAEGVELTWHRPEDYSGGQRMRDLGGFDVERKPGDGPAAATFTRVGHIELTDQRRFRQEPRIQWVDHDVEPAAYYQYRVIAFTLDGYRSQPAGPIAVVFTAKEAQ